ncbi:MAG: hypothetical protein ACXVI0_10025 [Halobacteriota archaeon]
MKRMQLIAVALCLMMIVTVGAGVVAAKQDENPRQAGSSSIYFYEVAAADTHGTGKLKIDVDKHTFEFNGQGFTPSAMIELKAKAVGGTDYVAFATGQATPSGNLNLKGTWEKGAALPAEVVGGYTRISGFILANWGVFVAKLACYYSTDGGVTWHESDHTSGIAWAGSKLADLGDLGVPDGALVKIHAIVVAGKDRTGSAVFQYEYVPTHDGPWYFEHDFAKYEISGVTWNPTLKYDEIERINM